VLTTLDGYAGDPSPDADVDGAAPDAALDRDAAFDAGADGSAAEDAGDAGDAGEPCPQGKGPPMVAASGFCIDATEVTEAQYQLFLNAGAASANPGPECAWNGSYSPSVACAFGARPNSPVRGVDWCDAAAFCAWAGKRLCGKIGGGPAPPASRATESVSQWYAACSAGGTRPFPYGATYDGAKCVGDDYDAGARPLDVGAAAGCVGGLPGLVDMSGNVSEWEDSCLPSTDGDAGADRCLLRGGDYASTTTDGNMQCGVALEIARSSALCYWGFRCCADL
jgi:formylglycine-generating enzyme required for sulfatase activity